MSAKFTADQLAEHTGVNGSGIYISVKGKVYDCSEGMDFYGPGKSYAVFAGKEATRPLAKMMISEDEANAGWGNLSEDHLETLEEWVQKFESKYPIVGVFVPDVDFIARGQCFAP